MGSGELLAIDKISDNICCIDGYFDLIFICCDSSQEFLNNLIK